MKKTYDFVYPSGVSRMLHLLRCRGFAVTEYSCTLGRLGATAFSAHATLGLMLSAVAVSSRFNGKHTKAIIGKILVSSPCS